MDLEKGCLVIGGRLTPPFINWDNDYVGSDLSNNVLIRISIHNRCLKIYYGILFINQRIEDMSGISSDLICRVIGGYRFSSSDADYRRYLNLNSLIEMFGISDSDEGSSDIEKEAAYVPEDDSGSYEEYEDLGEERGKEVEKGYSEEGGPKKYDLAPRQKSVSEGYVPPEIQRSINNMFREIVGRYFPGGYFKRIDYAKDISDEFFTRAYKRFKQILQKNISDKLKKYDIPETSLQFSPDMMYEVIMDALQFMSEHPADIKEGLIRAYTGDDKANVEDTEETEESTFEDFSSEDEEESPKSRGRKKKEEKEPLGEAQAFFVPRYDEGAFEERITQGDDVKKDDVDPEVVSNLKDRYEVKWDWKDLDEHKILHFTLPELYGGREFTIKLPPGIRDIKPGQYTFRIKSVKEGRGAIVEFLEQKVMLHKDKLDLIRSRKGGLRPDQLKKFIDRGIIDKYRLYLHKMPIGKLIERYKGEFSIGGNQINSVSDLDELSGLGDQSIELSKGRGSEEVKKKKEEAQSELQAKIDAVKDRWIPEIARHILKVPEADGARIVKLISSKFPPSSTKATPSFASILATQPIVENVLSHIMSPTTPLTGGGRGGPWMHSAMDDFGEMAIKNPAIRAEVEKMVRSKRGDQLPDQPVSDIEIEQFLKSSSKTIVNKFGELVKEIDKKINDNKNAPELQKFFERRRVFREYSGKVLGDEIAEYIEENGLSLSNPKDMKEIEKYFRKRLNQLVSSLERGKPFKRKKEQDKADQARQERQKAREELQKSLNQNRDEQEEGPMKVQREQRGAPSPSPVSKQSSDATYKMLVHRVMQRLSSGS